MSAASASVLPRMSALNGIDSGGGGAATLALVDPAFGMETTRCLVVSSGGGGARPEDFAGEPKCAGSYKQEEK